MQVANGALYVQDPQETAIHHWLFLGCMKVHPSIMVLRVPFASKKLLITSIDT